MKKLTTIILFCVTLAIGLGCGDDDGGGSTDPIPLSSLEVRTDLAAPPMTSVDDAVWSGVTPTVLALSNVNAPPVASPKPLFFTDSVWVQAIAASGRLYLRLEWDDDDLSLQRDNWKLNTIPSLNFTHNRGVFNEDGLYFMFEMPEDGGWDTWNWRSLTTGQTGCAEGMTFADSVFTPDADDGVHTLAWDNYNYGDASCPRWVHKDLSAFESDVLYINDTVPARADMNHLHWQIGQTIPGWVLVDSVLPAAMSDQSRWDIKAIYDYDDAAGHYKLVMSRSLSGGAGDLNLSGLTEVKAKIGIINDFQPHANGSGRIFTEDFMMDF
jgi:hypothetical protein